MKKEKMMNALSCVTIEGGKPTLMEMPPDPLAGKRICGGAIPQRCWLELDQEKSAYASLVFIGIGLVGPSIVDAFEKKYPEIDEIFDLIFEGRAENPKFETSWQHEGEEFRWNDKYDLLFEAIRILRKKKLDKQCRKELTRAMKALKKESGIGAWYRGTGKKISREIGFKIRVGFWVDRDEVVSPVTQKKESFIEK